ncbi:hypothetical protein BV22DRAFT_1113588 [Leucogyrophana mollusca]|uniref:Uncharacterized protein n=1 Tax=Leucogyrophana mollusca TaxID=85980 RepID=A0ACB8BBC9_9AGAM|nr:hypothetical protein BV22DRAFT_1113588 [Leucogyrophana mollusca]
MSRAVRLWFLNTSEPEDRAQSIPVTIRDGEPPLIFDDIEESLAKRLSIKDGDFRIWKLKEPLTAWDEVPEYIQLSHIADEISMLTPVLPFVSEVGTCEVHIIVVPDAPVLDIESNFNTSFLNIIQLAKAGATPSAAAESSKYRKIQAGPGRIMDGRYPSADAINTTAPPIQLFCPAFAYFSSKAFDDNYAVPEATLCRTAELMNQFAAIHSSERERRFYIRALFENIVGCQFWNLRDIDHTMPDGVVVCPLEGFTVSYLALDEDKNEIGDDSSDPSTQAALSYLRLLCRQENETLRLKSCTPMFLIAQAGPWLAILGGIITSRCIVQRLTDFIWVPFRSTHDEAQCLRIARILLALKESIHLLREWYRVTADHTPPYNPKGRPLLPHPRFFPSPTSFIAEGSLVRFTYQEPLEGHPSCVTYLVKIDDGDDDSMDTASHSDSSRMAVVKFVTRYGKEAHEQMAREGLAPPLLYCGPIHSERGISYGALHMVVMKYVEGWTAFRALALDRLPGTFLRDLREVIQRLHSLGFVYGDLRQPNVMVTKEGGQIQLIDFDWAGKKGIAKYPLILSNAIDWPVGVSGLQAIEEQHDLDMLSPERWRAGP